MSFADQAGRYVAAIRSSGISIYEPVEVGSALYIPSPELEYLLNRGLVGLPTGEFPIRTRSKVVKSKICEVLGYPVPPSFKKTRPRFAGQNFDAFTQKSTNFQPYNGELNPLVRYALIQQRDGILTKVRVVTGQILAELDRTGTQTKKHQARIPSGCPLDDLVSRSDTSNLRQLIGDVEPRPEESPTDYPQAGRVLSIAAVNERLKPLIGVEFPDAGRDQERNRGASLHRLICKSLGYNSYADDGRCPDVKHQLIEVKLQTSPTIDLGLITPASKEPLDIPKVNGVQVKHCDLRYAVFEASTDGNTVTIKRLHLTTGEDFFSRFPKCGGLGMNAKNQIRLPLDFFDAESLADLTL